MNVITRPGAAHIAPPPIDRTALWRGTALASAAVGLLAVGALSATLWQRHTAEPAVAASTAMAPAPAAAPADTPATTPTASATLATPPAAARAPAHAGTAKAQHHAAATPTEAPRSADTTPLATQPAALPAPAAAAVCADCGVVESVATVTHPGQGSGVGAVAGGVLGGVLGHQIGGGGGRKALTVLGAIGGGLAGNEIEKRQRATTDYRVTVRMDDGSRRVLTQAQPPAVGQPVRVDGNQLLPTSTARPAMPREGAREPGTLQTAARG